MIADVVSAALSAAATLDHLGREGRAQLLERLADAVEREAGALVALAAHETALPEDRLAPETRRTSNQLRLFAEVVREGSYLGVVVDEADPDAAPPRPELRRMRIPIGPVVVFEASNFPFAFGVLGGDTASALAAGCPVVVKVHPAHAATSRAVGRIVAEVLSATGLPAGVLQLVEGVDAGIALVTADGVAAVGFTGSARGGAAIEHAIAGRREPITFYGELGSVNPVVVTRSAAEVRPAAELGAQIADSVLTASGQLCTKPGLVLVPAGAAGDDIAAELHTRIVLAAPADLISPSIADAFRARDSDASSEGRTVVPAVQEFGADAVGADDLEERFGPAVVILRYRSQDEVEHLFRRIGGQLTASLVAASVDDPDAPGFVAIATRTAGRIVFNGMPTGVAVTWAQQHGGPRPATTAPATTSVGATAIDRWLRPIVYQDWPGALLPRDVADPAAAAIPYRLNGVLTRAARA